MGEKIQMSNKYMEREISLGKINTKEMRYSFYLLPKLVLIKECKII
jgi:hypothetical protein